MFYEDLDLNLRFHKTSYYALYVPDAVIHHDPSRTIEDGQFTDKYVQHKARNWFAFMRRHAPLWKQLTFCSVGAPLILARMLRRKDGTSFFRKLAGLLPGVYDARRNRHH